MAFFPFFSQYLDMSGVNLAKISSDNLFHAVNMLPALSVFDSSKLPPFTQQSNQLHIPLWLTNSSRLVHLDLWFNHFHGVIPESIGHMESLEVIQLGFNDFVGLLPTSISRDLCNLHTLISHSIISVKTRAHCQEFYPDVLHCTSRSLLNNQITGTVPKSPQAHLFKRSFFPILGGNVPTLGHLYLSNNLFKWHTSCIYMQLPADAMALNLANNKISGEIPVSLGSLKLIQVLHLGNDNLSGEIPLPLSNLKIPDP
ncbi:receptor-like protein kinase [Dioscorea cayenensis subsp. rotundata]|uniref:Receptor-like protein kinase n=1 Tax=Dioscorea cayennensis subsp. rotundata TaxID=55577 RepID=A0AB40C3P0_DIOCR|nr:receptor-like protein kinase [Dioscorea cayenensis subsp. rotundata]